MTDKSRRYDVLRGHGHATMDYHFCREIGCYGTNPEHGYSLYDAITSVIETCDIDIAAKAIAEYIEHLHDEIDELECDK